MNFKKLHFSFILCFLFTTVLAQEEDIFGISQKAKNPKSESGLGNITRNVLEAFSLEISGGGAYQQFGTSFYSANTNLYPFSRFQNLDGDPLDISEENPLEMKGGDWVFPNWNGGIRVNLFNLLTIGGGFGQEWGNLAPMQGGDYQFDFEGATYQVNKLYGTVGLVLYDANRRRAFLNWRYRNYSSSNLYMQSELRQRARQNYPWRFIAEAEFGKLDLKKSYDPALAAGGAYEPRLAVSDKNYYGIGLRIERDFSEYTKMFVKGGADFRSFTYAASDFSEFQDLEQKVYAMQVGLAVRFPGTKRCKIGGCGVVMKHMHNGIEYRGSGIFNFQDRKVGQWY
ncbi:hypothetical protein SAMN04489724_4143 [Algoriphagus locisalis]|uniref:Bacterial surface antigen (D15) domain-containing protein n=1 Tax=Algoriphagus locisalis TaxID=305507 RepID=A0A1I7DLZ4_9BACT|nr:hypothetical protein [Algoriphagus locisalis]SFU12721.1 hypothetical protein SAMN04489724_4143 [Algoriphagus locisalis]